MRRYGIPIIGSWRHEGGAHSIGWRYTTTSVIPDYPFSMGCWYWTYSNGVLLSLGATDTTGDNQTHRLAVGGTSALVGSTTTTDTTAQDAVNTSNYGGRGWHYALGVWTSATDRIIYVDGRRAGQSTTNRSPNTPYPTLTIGANNVATPTNGHQGSLLWPSVWDIALTQADAISLWMGTAPTDISPYDLRHFLPNMESGQCYVTGVNFTLVKNASTQPAMLSRPELPIQLAHWHRRRRFHFIGSLPSFQSVAVGLATETDTAITRSYVKRPSAETDSAQTLGRIKLRPVDFYDKPGILGPTDYAFALSKKKIRATQIATETDSSLALNFAKKVGLSTETDTSLSLTRRKTKALGLSTETDTSLALSRAKSKAAQISAETDSSLALSRKKAKAAGLGAETDSSFALSKTKSKATAFGSETDSALALTAATSGTYGVALETDTSIALGRKRFKSVGLSTESDSAVSLTRLRIKNVGLATETDTSLALSRVKKKGTGISSSTNAALALGLVSLLPFQLAAETNSSLALSRIKSKAISTSLESDTALALQIGAGTQVPVGLAVETDTAQALARTKIKAFTYPVEFDAPFPYATIGSVKKSGNAGTIWHGINSGINGVISSDGSRAYINNGSGALVQVNFGVPGQPATVSPDNFKIFYSESDTSGFFLKLGLLSQHFAVSADERYLYLWHNTNKTLYQYEMLTPGNIETLQYTGRFFSNWIPANPSPQNFRISPDGTKLFFMSGTTIYEYGFGTPYDVGTLGVNHSTSTNPVSSGTVHIPASGNYLYVIDGSYIFHMYMTTPWTLSSAMQIGGRSDSPFGSNSGMYLADDGKYWVHIADDYSTETYRKAASYLPGFRRWDMNEFGRNQKYYSSDAYEYEITVSPSPFTPHFLRSPNISFLFTHSDTVPQSLHWKPDGTRVYILNRQNDNIVEYSLSIPWDVRTMSYVGTLSIAAQTTAPKDLFIDSSGAYLFVSGGDSGATLYQYTIGTPWTISTGIYTTKSWTPPNALDNFQEGSFDFKPDGTRLFYKNGSRWGQVDLASPFDLLTVQNGTIGYGICAPGANQNFSTDFFEISSDGTEARSAGSSRYFRSTLRTAWDIRTITVLPHIINMSPSISLSGNSVGGLYWKSDGKKLWRVTSPTSGNFGRIREVVIGLSTGISFNKARAVLASLETDEAFALIRHIGALPVLFATETDTSYALERKKFRALELAAETDTALARVLVKVRTYARAEEIDEALYYSTIIQALYGIAEEFDTAPVSTVPPGWTMDQRRLWTRFLE